MNTRKYVLDILMDIESNHAFSNIAINRCLKDKNLKSIDRRFISELVYGVLENKIYLDFIIHKLSKIKIQKLDAAVLNILRMGLYQIIYLDKVPPFAAVNESVVLAKSMNKKFAGYVNGLLRNFLRNRQTIKIPTFQEDPLEHLSIKYSHPRWMVKRWVEEFGQEFTRALLQANNETPKLIIRTNTLKMTRKELMEALRKENIDVIEGLYVEESIHMHHVGNIEELESYRKGFFQIQDESSMLVTHVLDPKPGEFIIDVCAAPGGKTSHIAQRMKNKGCVLARDIYEHKLKLILDNASRLGINIIKTECFNAKELDQDLLNKGDKILVDAPCSGLGIIRRKPELKYSKKPSDSKKLSKIQLEILNNASKYVKIGGSLVYSTCTIEKEENINVIEKFMQYNKNFEMVDINSCIPARLKTENRYLQLYPNIHKTDGFFICKFKKIGS